MQNRNKLIDLLVGNLATAVVHRILEMTIEDESIRRAYDKELLNSFTVAQRYRARINPPVGELSPEEKRNMRERIARKAKNELLLRIRKGYKNLNVEHVESCVTELLEELEKTILKK